MPQISAAVVRSAPSSTSASASIRRAARASLVWPAAARSSLAVSSRRVISIAGIPASSASNSIESEIDPLGNPPRVTGRGRWYYFEN